jgi:hypothetical protein
MYNLPIVKKILTNKTLVYILLILVGTIIFFKPPTDPDFGWHYKYGEYIFQNKKILRENIFSYTHTNYQWSNSYWLSQLLMYTSHRFLGHSVSTIILSAFLSFVILHVIKKHAKDRVSLSVLFLFLVLVLTMFAVTVRPLYYSTVFLFILIDILLRKGAGIKYIPLIFLAWVNMHADFVIGLFILGAYSLFNFLEKTGFPKTNFKSIFPPWKTWSKTSKYLGEIRLYFIRILKDKNTLNIFVKLFLIFFVSFLITFLNPYGINLWLTLFKEFTQPIKSFVAEWGPMGEIGFSYLLIGIFLAMGLLAGITAKSTNAEKYDSWYIFLIFLFYPLSLKSAYFIRIFIIISSFSVLDRFVLIKKDIEKIIVKDAKQNLKYFLVPFLAFLLFSLIPNLIISYKTTENIELWSEAKKYPYGAVKYVKENKLEGKMMNEYSWGGYLIWQLPEYKTFIDGRMAAWRIDGNYLMEDHRKIYLKTEKNEELVKKYLEEYNISWILHKPDSSIVKYLKEKNGDVWETVYEDDISVIIVRK